MCSSTMPQLALIRPPLPFPMVNQDDHDIHIISNLLSESECYAIIQNCQNLIQSNVTPDTVRTRQVFENQRLSEEVWERMKGFYECEKGRLKDADGEYWRVTGLNERWRLCLYERGGRFSPHQDSRFLASVDSQSFMAVNIYLSTVPESLGGATRFLTGPPSFPVSPEQVWAKVQPELGSATVFRDVVWHDGEELLDGKKYLLRTDIMFEREEQFDFQRLWGTLTEEERARRCLAIAEGLEDSGQGEEAVVWYRKAFRLWPALVLGG